MLNVSQIKLVKDMKEEILDIAKKLYHNHLTPELATDLLVSLFGVGKSLPIGDVEILLKGLEHIGKWGDEKEERWDDPGDCAIDTLTQYRYSMSIR
jgi:hypothetical protein